MDHILLKDYRCFADEQKARLAPLTFLVGENSTGKTSFLAMVRTLCELARNTQFPDFKESPYDLGSFDEIAHYRGGSAGRAERFEAGFITEPAPLSSALNGDSFQDSYTLRVTFGKRGTTPVPVRSYAVSGDNWVEKRVDPAMPKVFRCGTARGKWEMKISPEIPELFSLDVFSLPPLSYLMSHARGDHKARYTQLEPLSGSPEFTSEDERKLRNFDFAVHGVVPWPFAGAPVRSKPRRTYDPSRPTRDPEGDYIPMYLANIHAQERKTWVTLKNKLEAFGSASGLFDEISIKRLGKRESEPFQLQVRRFDKGRKGPQRNLIDMGYGVSQALPIITEMLRRDAPDLFLLQQPEVHLHPSAQAALGSLFCQVAAQGRQLIVETHSDYILDRIRMDVRDGKTDLKPEDVSILFFERQGLSVQIHSIRLDNEGNVLDAPPSYGDFFIHETTRSLGL